MKLDLVVSPGRRFVPATDEDREKARALRPGDILPVRIRKPRNGDHHRKFRALVAFVADHHPKYRSQADVMVELKLRTGHYREFIRRETGEMIYVPLSTAFDEMDEGEFVLWSGKAKEVIFDHMLPGFTARDKRRLEGEIEAWQRWT